NGQLPSDNLSLVKIHCGAVWVATAADGVVRLPGMIEGGFTDVADDGGAGLPSSMHLYANYPNPFNPVTTIEFDLKQQADITVAVYDVRGRLIQTLLSGVRAAGSHRVVWDGRDLNGTAVSSGVYIYQLKTGDAVLSRKMMLMK
ncbi:T9SS type A sorting domain-containing protein, partial [bacterium]|nr:T9SS type A sorting domain-containing protein [bacterium]